MDLAVRENPAKCTKVTLSDGGHLPSVDPSIRRLVLRAGLPGLRIRGDEALTSLPASALVGLGGGGGFGFGEEAGGGLVLGLGEVGGGGGIWVPLLQIERLAQNTSPGLCQQKSHGMACP